MKDKILFTAVVCLTMPFHSSQGQEIVYTKPVKAVVFSHKAHTENLGLQCEWCHNETFDMRALKMQGEADFNMESLCNEKYCGVCHNGEVAFSTATQCARCHIGEKGYNEMVRQGKVKAGERSVPTQNAPPLAPVPNVMWHEDLPATPPTKALQQMIKDDYYPGPIELKPEGAELPVIFDHKTHFERKQQRCTECHPGLFKMQSVKNFGEKRSSPYTMMVEKGKYCGACHNGEKAFSLSDRANCAKCHHAPSAGLPQSPLSPAAIPGKHD